MDSTQLMTYAALAVSLGSVVIGVLNHKKIRLKCCGHSHDISFDIGESSPETTVQNPIPHAAPTPIAKPPSSV